MKLIQPKFLVTAVWILPRSAAVLVMSIVAFSSMDIQAINNGKIDRHASYSVRVDSTCTGVLITPRWVLTANHCITGLEADPAPSKEGLGINADVNITVVPKGASDVNHSSAQTFTHSNSTSGNIIVRKNSKMELGPYADRDDASRDLALIRLDEPVPLSIARPLHPPLLGVPKCPADDFIGRISGFAEGNVRKYSNSEDYLRDNSPNLGSVYENEWILPVPVPPFGAVAIELLPVIGSGALVSTDVYKGIMAGDSGGPLVYQGGGQTRLCGIASGIYVALRPHIMCGPIPCLTIGQLHAAVDSPAALSWLEANVVVNDIFGVKVFDGECSSSLYSSCDDAMLIRLIQIGVI